MSSTRTGAAGWTSVAIDVAGLPVRVETRSASDLELLRRVLGNRPATRRPEVVLRLGEDAPGPVPATPPDFAGPYGDHWDDGTRHHFVHHWGLSALVTAERAELGGAAGGYRRWVAVRNALLFVLARLFLERDRFVLHAAGLRRDSRGLVVVGDSGAGKSTLAFAAGRSGWGVLGDDMVVVDRRDGVATVQGVPRVPSVPGDVARAAGVDGEPLVGDDRERTELTGAPLDPDAVAIECVVVSGHGTGPGVVEALDPTTALHEITPAFVLSELPGPLRRWFPLAAVLARGPRARLLQPDSAAARLARADALLGDALTAARRGDHPNPPDATSSR